MKSSRILKFYPDSPKNFALELITIFGLQPVFILFEMDLF